VKLSTFELEGESESRQRVGAISTDGAALVDLAAAEIALDGKSSACFGEMLAFLDGGAAARNRAEQLIEFVSRQQPPGVLHPLSSVRLLAPVPRPRSIRDCMAFEQHLVRATRTVVKWRSPLLARIDAWVERRRGKALFGAPRVWYERPIYYKGNPHSVVGPGADVLWPPWTEKLDYELEFGVFLGRRGRDIPEAKARDYIAGYTIFNDFSARDVQLAEMQGRLGPAKSKDFDTGNVLGPYLVTADEVPDPYSLTMVARVNGEEWSRGASSQMHYSLEEIIAYISRDETIHPGEFIGSGTVPTGCGLELDRWLAPGDTVELEVDRLGMLRNRVLRNPVPVGSEVNTSMPIG
jgi:2-keto-4-pentenoate hydratase/2-oxohepta-3-ene-1,7-dioic acid hydratase in catechol pathway